MNQIEAIAAYLPYMTCPGNHEEHYNFSNYVNRFSMPNSLDLNSIGGDNNHFFSINIGPIHLVSFSSEFYYYIEYGLHQMAVQYDWLVQDLKVSFTKNHVIIPNLRLSFLQKANLPENRAKQPCKIHLAENIQV